MIMRNAWDGFVSPCVRSFLSLPFFTACADPPTHILACAHLLTNCLFSDQKMSNFFFKSHTAIFHYLLITQKAQPVPRREDRTVENLRQT